MFPGLCFPGTSWGTFGILIPIVTGVFTDPTTGAIVPGAEHLIIIGVSACRQVLLWVTIVPHLRYDYYGFCGSTV